MSAHEIMVMFLALGTLLASARILGEVARYLGGPAVLGEVIAGVLLGPTVLGALAPEAFEFLFPPSGAPATFLSGFTTVAVALFLLVAGMEVDLSTVWRQGRTAVVVGFAGLIFPFGLGYAVGFFFPGWLGFTDASEPQISALFFATALSISALSMITKTLLDLNLYRSDFGMVVISAAILDDLVGWMIFAVLLSALGSAQHGPGVGHSIWLTLGFTAVMLTIGRWLIDHALRLLQREPGWVLGFALTLTLFGAGFTEWLGIHAVFGAFVVGIALGDSTHLREQTRRTMQQFISFIFAPIFYASIGLRVDFARSFDVSLVLVVLFIACAGKVLGCGMGARLAGMRPREAWATGIAMNARGSMEIILGLFAFQHGLIGEPMLVALVVLTLVTSILSGPLMKRVLQRPKPHRFLDYLRPATFVGELEATARREAILELVGRVCAATPALHPDDVATAVLAREALMPTGVGNRVAVPHARLEGLRHPVVGVGLSATGIDFDAPDGQAAQVVFLLLTPSADDGAQVELLADISRTFGRGISAQALPGKDYVEFLEVVRAAPAA